MNVLLIQPRAYAHNPQLVNEPLNLGYLASYLIERGYRDVNIRLGAFEPEDDIIREASMVEVVGMTATSPMMSHARLLASSIKKVNPTTVIVLGGPHPTVAVEDILSDKNIDIVVRGEGEQTFYELVYTLEHKGSLQSVQGISYKQDGQIVYNRPRQLIPDIEAIPYPARNLMHQDFFVSRSPLRTAWILSSRGCPFQCIYCASHKIWSRRCRTRSPENILGEIETLVNDYCIKQINFADDTFTISKQRIMHLCELLREKDLRISWACNAHVNTVDEEMFQAMKDAGCVEVWMGVESGSPTILRELKKGSNLERIREVFSSAKKVGLRRYAYMLVGSPSESKKTIQESEKLLKELHPEHIQWSIMTPYPGSEIYDTAKEQGYVSDGTDWSTIDLASHVTMPTKHLSKQNIKREFDRLSAKWAPKAEFDLLFLIKAIVRNLRLQSIPEWSVLVWRFWRYIRRKSLDVKVAKVVGNGDS